MILGRLILAGDGTIRAANEAVSDLLGLKVEDWIGRPVQELWVAARCSSFEDAMTAWKEIADGATAEREGVLILAGAGKNDRPLGWRASRLLDAGQTGSVWLIWEETGGAGRAPQPLAYFLDQLVSAFPVIVYLYDVASMRCLYISGQVTSILGYSGEALSDMNPLFLLALSHPDDTAGLRDYIQQVISAGPGEAIEREIRLRSQAGDWVWLRSRESVFATSASGEAQQIVGVATDITARHMAWEELVSSEALFRSLLENTNAIPFEYDFLSDRFTYIGPQAQELLGYPLYRWCQKGFWASIIHPEDAGVTICLQVAKSQEVEDGKDIQTEGRLRAADGRYVWIGQALRCGTGEDGRRRARGFLLDITRRKDREMKLESSRLLLRQHASHIQAAREEERTSIARELHDELGQALTLFNMDVDWMHLQFASDAPRPSESVIVRKLEEMKNMIAGTSQTLRRILTNLRPPVLDELGLAAAIEWQAREFSRRAALRCEVHAEPIECPNESVATATFRIFQEVLTNIARHAHATLVKVSLRRDQDRLILTVSDNGIGFAISEPEKKQSFGLLGIRERAAALGGALQVLTAKGEGTTITVSFPLTGDAALPEDALLSAEMRSADLDD